MKFEGIDFSEEWVRSISEKEFIEHEKHHGLKDKQLKEIYRLINPPKKVGKPGTSATPSEATSEEAAP